MWYNVVVHLKISQAVYMSSYDGSPESHRGFSPARSEGIRCMKYKLE
jgi:hypothetical protein